MRLRVLAAAAAFTVYSVGLVSGQDLIVDTTGAGALIDEALNRSEVMQNLQYLSDVIGPRLTGSSAARRANDWTLERFEAYGLDAHLEPWQFGGTWTRGPIRARMTAPRAHDVIGELGLGAGHRRRRHHGARGTDRRHHARQLRGVSRSGEEGMGNDSRAVARVEHRRAAHDRRRLAAAA